MKTPREFAKIYYNIPSGSIDPTSYQLERMVAERDAEWQSSTDDNRPTVRQQYAMAALTGMLAYKDRISNIKRIALEAFAIADAMIAQEAKE